MYICLFVFGCLFVCLFVCLYVCLNEYLYKDELIIDYILFYLCVNFIIIIKVMNELDALWLPVVKTWRLNERMCK